MNVITWSPEERAEYQALCEEAWAASDRQAQRINAYLAALHDAEQAQRFYAREVLAEAERRGAEALLKGWQKDRQRIAVAHDGRVLNRSRVVGTTRRDESGQTFATQTLFDLLTWDEIEAKVTEFSRQVRAYRDNIILAMRLLGLRDLAPESHTPDEAARSLGITVEDFLMDEHAA